MRLRSNNDWLVSNRCWVQLPLRGGLTLVLSFLLLALNLAGTFHNCVAQESEHHYEEEPIGKYARYHWSFQPLKQVDTPDTELTNWGRNAIDQFIVAKLESKQLTPQEEADRRTLLRRVKFDLTGLPPTPQELHDFESDTRPDAYERLVDRLLDSPQYGERWAQHWLDLARFAETDGFEHDKVRKEAWTYRDWVIDALNKDMPYDEFVRKQLAGDELEPDNPDAITATRFCLSGPDMPDINLIEERRHTVLNELTATVGETILGLQIGCAQCHDHKYDPISQADFYRLRAIFEPAISLKKNESLTVLQETFPYDKPSHLMLRGSFRDPGPELEPGVIRVATTDTNPFSPQQRENSAGLRSAFSEWLFSQENPLTARVIVNRVWQHHFGTGLVESSSDFGSMGSEPTHPELLDWLASTFIEQGWSLKTLHRQIVTSSTYRQRSRLSPQATDVARLTWAKNLKLDPKGQLLSRFPRQRLEGEAIRDAILLASGQLNLKAGGPGVRPPLPAELVDTLLTNQWNVTPDESEHTRRSIYVFARRNLRYPIFEVFDRPSANASCSRRAESTTAPQSLHLLNSEFSFAMATKMANSIMEETSSTEERVSLAFERALGRMPTSDEREDIRAFFQSSGSDAEAENLAHLCLSLFNCNEFVTID